MMARLAGHYIGRQTHEVRPKFADQVKQLYVKTGKKLPAGQAIPAMDGPQACGTVESERFKEI